MKSRLSLLLLGCLLWGLAGCGETGFVPMEGGMDIVETDFGPPPDTGPDAASLGRACTRNAECNDGIDCTDDLCASDNRCVNVANHSRCDDNVYCNGAERCDTRRGCARGEPVSCNDSNVCTGDRCIEATRTCESVPLDRDGDGDPDDHCQARSCGDAGIAEPDTGVMTSCWRGRDCDDRDPRVSSRAPEICGDNIDNNCNGAMDSMEPGGCMRARYDTCEDPIDVSAGGTFTVPVAAARGEQPLPCFSGQAHDVVARFRLTEPKDLVAEASTGTSSVALALMRAPCGGITSLCDVGFPARLRSHSLPAGEYFLVAATNAMTDVELVVRFDDATPQPTNDTCMTATEIPAAGGVFRSDLVGLRDDISTRCGGSAPDALYRFTLTELKDVTLQLAGTRGDFLQLSLFQDCSTRVVQTLRCDSGQPVSFTQHQLGPGTYYVAVESFESGPYTLQASFNAPTPPVAGDTCSNPLTLRTGMATRVDTLGMENDYQLSCYSSGRDAVLRFELTERRDVQIDVNAGTGDFFGASLSTMCAQRTGERTCTTGSNPRISALGLDPGTYFLTVKTTRAVSYDVSLQTFPPLMVMTAMGNDTCGNAQMVMPGRAYYSGSTATLVNDYRSPCGGSSPGKDAVYQFSLGTRQRVTIVTDSSFFHTVWVTRRDGCPGSAVPSTAGNSCTIGTRTTLDLTLDPGMYNLFVDGFNMRDEGTYSVLITPNPAP